jgi:hypothetical protein
MPEDKTIDQKHYVDMQTLATHIDRVLNGDDYGEKRTTAFVLLIADGSDAKLCNYISNAERADMISVLKAIIIRLEGN